MTHMFVVNGGSLRVSVDDPHAFGKELGALESFKDIQQRGLELGLIVQVAPCSGSGLVDVFVGKEILPDRHLAQGETTVAPLWNTKQFRKMAAPLADDLTEVLMGLGCGVVEEAWGIVVNVFD